MMRIRWNHTTDPPKVEESYLCTLDTGELCVCTWVCGYYLGGQVIHPESWHWNCPQYTHVIAWMLLPEPYHPDNIESDGES